MTVLLLSISATDHCTRPTRGDLSLFPFMSIVHYTANNFGCSADILARRSDILGKAKNIRGRSPNILGHCSDILQ